MDIRETTILAKGGGELGSAVARKLFKSGLKVAVLDLPVPMSIRRKFSFSTAVIEGSVTVNGFRGKKIKQTPDFRGSFVSVFTTENKKILSDYKVPMVFEIPDDCRSELIFVKDPYEPFGVKSIGEDVSNGAAPVLATAIYNTAGVWMRKWPFTPEKIYKALHNKKQK